MDAKRKVRRENKKRLNKRRGKLLGIDMKNARSKLYKFFAYAYFVLKHGASCRVCGETVQIDDMTLEHIKPWMLCDNPINAYYDLENVDLCHEECNQKAWGSFIAGKKYEERIKDHEFKEKIDAIEHTHLFTTAMLKHLLKGDLAPSSMGVEEEAASRCGCECFYCLEKKKS